MSSRREDAARFVAVDFRQAFVRKPAMRAGRRGGLPGNVCEPRQRPYYLPIRLTPRTGLFLGYIQPQRRADYTLRSPPTDRERSTHQASHPATPGRVLADRWWRVPPRVPLQHLSRRLGAGRPADTGTYCILPPLPPLPSPPTLAPVGDDPWGGRRGSRYRVSIGVDARLGCHGGHGVPPRGDAREWGRHARLERSP